NNDNLTYAVNNWVGAAAAANHLASQPRLQILEVGAGTGSATEILLHLLDERGLLPRLERYLITEPNAYFRRCNQRKLAAQYPNPGFLTAEQWRRAFVRADLRHPKVAPNVEAIREIYPHFFTGAIYGQKTATAA